MKAPSLVQLLDVGARLFLLASALAYVAEPLLPRRLACGAWGHVWMGVDIGPVCRRCNRQGRHP